MSKYSVRKPFTVLVAVIIILVTGLVSYSKMTPDLLPSMDMPYVIVVTPYVGATPEKVETNLTKPLEQNFSTLTDIKTVQSVSNANYSMVIMEFENSVNMDTVSSDILQKINLVEGTWEDAVGTPTIMKINPNMIPVAVTAVNYKDMDRAQLSAFVKDTLLNKLEGTSGVASIDDSGIMEEKVNVVISQDKIDNINNKILASINTQLADAQNQLNTQKKQLADTKTTLAESRDKLEAGKAYMPKAQYDQQIAVLDKSDKEISDGEVKLKEAQKDLDSQAASARASANIGDKITSEMISGILKGQNFDMPAGYIEEGGSKYMVSVGDEITTEKQAKNLYIFDSGVDSVGKVYLGDVADVFIKNNGDTLYAKINGDDGILLSFSKQSNYATADVCTNIQEKFQQLSKEYDGLSFTNLMNQGDYIELVVGSIVSSLLWGALLAILILLLFLREIKPTFITLCSIPISIIFGVLMMYFSGITINLISMSGLAVSVGMLVDNSVVVIENIVRLRRQGIPAPKAAVAGAKQVSGAITASTLTTISVFVPIIFTEGITKQLFTDMALTIAYTLIASLLIALTLVPAMSASMLGNGEKKESKAFLKMLDKYRQSVTFVLRHKAPILILALALLGGSIYFSVIRGFIFMPEMNSPQLQATMEMPAGSNFNETKAAADDAMKKMEKIEGVKTVGAMMSSDQMMNQSTTSTQVSFYVILEADTDIKSQKVASEINRVCKDSVGTVTAASSSMGDFTSALGGSGISINVFAADLDELQESAAKVTSVLENTEGIDTVESGLDTADKEYHFKVDKTAAMEKGLTVAQVYQAITDAMSYEDDATSVTWGTDSYDVVVSSEAKKPLTTKDIKDLTLTIDDTNGTKTVKLNEVADLEEKETLQSIHRENQQRVLTVNATLKDGYNITNVTSDAQIAVDKLSLPTGTTVEFTGENETIMSSMSDLIKMIMLGIVLVYLIMVAQFQSLKSPFIIMFTIPLAFTGGLLTLLLTGKEISVIAMIGMVMLTGIIVNNGIVLVDYINQLRAAGMAKREAIIRAGMTRMRPILMTSLTTILGLMVMAFGNTAGTDMMQPVALVCIGGLVYATLLTLYIVPVIYDLLNGEKYKHISEADVDISNMKMTEE